MRDRSRSGWFVVVVALVVGAIVLWLSRGSSAPSSPPIVEVPAVTSANVSPLPSLPSPVSAPTPAPPPSALSPVVTKVRKPLIEVVEVSPQQPCRDEEVLVSVRLKPSASHAKVSIRGRMGDRAIFLFDRAGPVDVHVLADDWVDGLDSRSVRVTVSDCVGPPRLLVRAELVGVAVYRFTAVAPEGERIEQVRWRVGDEGWTTAGTTIERSFALRKQRTVNETVLIEAESGSHRRGRTTVFLVNQSQLTRLMGHAFLPVVASQFPERVDGTLVSTIETRNLFGRPIAFDSLVVRAFGCADGATVETVLPASRVIGRTALDADAIGTLRVVLPERVAANACTVELRLEGQVAGEPFTAMWGLATGVPSAGAQRLNDPALAERLFKAQQVLGRTQITPADLERLERGQ